MSKFDLKMEAWRQDQARQRYPEDTQQLAECAATDYDSRRATVDDLLREWGDDESTTDLSETCLGNGTRLLPENLVQDYFASHVLTPYQEFQNWLRDFIQEGPKTLQEIIATAKQFKWPVTDAQIKMETENFARDGYTKLVGNRWKWIMPHRLREDVTGKTVDVSKASLWANVPDVRKLPMTASRPVRAHDITKQAAQAPVVILSSNYFNDLSKEPSSFPNVEIKDVLMRNRIAVFVDQKTVNEKYPFGIIVAIDKHFDPSRPVIYKGKTTLLPGDLDPSLREDSEETARYAAVDGAGKTISAVKANNEDEARQLLLDRLGKKRKELDTWKKAGERVVRQKIDPTPPLDNAGFMESTNEAVDVNGHTYPAANFSQAMADAIVDAGIKVLTLKEMKDGEDTEVTGSWQNQPVKMIVAGKSRSWAGVNGSPLNYVVVGQEESPEADFHGMKWKTPKGPWQARVEKLAAKLKKIAQTEGTIREGAGDESYYETLTNAQVEERCDRVLARSAYGQANFAAFLAEARLPGARPLQVLDSRRSDRRYVLLEDGMAVGLRMPDGGWCLLSESTPSIQIPYNSFLRWNLDTVHNVVVGLKPERRLEITSNDSMNTLNIEPVVRAKSLGLEQYSITIFADGKSYDAGLLFLDRAKKDPADSGWTLKPSQDLDLKHGTIPRNTSLLRIIRMIVEEGFDKDGAWAGKSLMDVNDKQALRETKLTIKAPVPDCELDDRQLIERVKSYGKDAQSSYGLYVKARGLRPELDMKKFKDIFDAVSPNSHINVRTIDFEPTHKSKADPEQTIMVTTRKPGSVHYVLGYGGTGSEPAAMFDQNWIPIR